MAVRVETEPLRASPPEFLFERDIGPDSFVPTFDAAPDGSFLMPLFDDGPQELRVVQNWLSEIEKLVPIP